MIILKEIMEQRRSRLSSAFAQVFTAEEYDDDEPVRVFRASDDIAQNIFVDNTDCVIDDPFARWMPHEVDTYTRRFAREHALTTMTELFVKAGRILQDPMAWSTVRGLTDAEKAALASEHRSRRHIFRALREESFFTSQSWKRLANELFPANGFWRQPEQLRVTTITLCVAAVAQGWSQTGSNGANLNWAQALLDKFLDPDGRGCEPHGDWVWIFALVNAAPYLAASFVGCWMSDPLSEGFVGRRVPIAIAAFCMLCAAIGSGGSQNWEQLLLCRILLGFGMGCKAAVVPVFAAEIAPAHLRGSLVMNWQLFDAFGIFLGFTANLLATVAGASAWRWQFASAALPALVLLGQIYASPESPRFLMKRGKYRSAYRALLELRGDPILAAKELLYVHCQIEIEGTLLALGPSEVEDSLSKTKRRWTIYPRKLQLIFTRPRLRRAALAAVVSMVGQQMCGVNVLQFYSSTLYGDAAQSCGEAYRKQPSLTPLWLTWGVGLANFVFAFPAYWLIDRKGRRWLLLATLPFMAVSIILIAGLAFEIDKDHPAHVAVVALFTYIFMFFYSWGMGPVPFTYAAECFPLEVRMVGMSFSVFTNFLGAGALALLVPVLTGTRMHQSGLLGLFCGFNVLAFILVFLLFPETAGAAIAVEPDHGLGNLASMSLEELNYLFGVRTRTHIKYRWRVVLRYWWKRHILRKKNAEKPPKLYKWPPHRERQMEAIESRARASRSSNGGS